MIAIGYSFVGQGSRVAARFPNRCVPVLSRAARLCLGLSGLEQKSKLSCEVMPHVLGLEAPFWEGLSLVGPF